MIGVAVPILNLFTRIDASGTRSTTYSVVWVLRLRAG